MKEEQRFNKQDYDNQYIKNNYDRINFVMPPGYKSMISEAAGQLGVKTSEFIREAIKDKLISCGVWDEKKILLKKQQDVVK